MVLFLDSDQSKESIGFTMCVCFFLSLGKTKIFTQLQFLIKYFLLFLFFIQKEIIVDI